MNSILPFRGLRSVPAAMLALAGALAGFGCSTKADFPSYGLRKIEIRMDPQDVGEMYGSATAKIAYPATLFVDGEEHEVKIQPAGNSTIRSPKKSFNLRLEKGKYRGAREFRITAATNDPSLLRPLLALEVFRAAGLPASWAEPAYAYLNDTVLGLYVAMERVDEDYFHNRGLVWDRIFEAEGDADFGPTFEARVEQAIGVVPKTEDHSAMVAVVRTMRIADDAEFMNALFRILDRDDVIAYMAAGQLTNHWDGFNKNIYYYRDPGTGVLALAPWDFDNTWSGDLSALPEAWHLNHLFSRLGENAGFRAEVQAKIAAMLAGDASEAALTTKLAEWRTAIADAYANDPWLGRAGKSLADEAARLDALVRARIALVQ